MNTKKVSDCCNAETESVGFFNASGRQLMCALCRKICSVHEKKDSWEEMPLGKLDKILGVEGIGTIVHKEDMVRFETALNSLILEERKEAKIGLIIDLSALGFIKTKDGELLLEQYIKE